MPIIALLARKGGAGKTTLAVHLAVAAGARGVLVDTDPQRSAERWRASRSAEGPRLFTESVASAARLLSNAETTDDVIVIDTPPAAGDDIADLASVVDLILVPTRASILDLRALESTVHVAVNARRSAMFVLNATPWDRGVAEAGVVTEARRVLERSYGLPVCPVKLAQRAPFSHAFNNGLTAQELEPASRAASEVRELWQHVQKSAAHAG